VREVILESVYAYNNRHQILWDLLLERDESVNISHRQMPTWDQHQEFIESRPYKSWYFVCDPSPVGACYLTNADEIGAFIFKQHHKKGYGRFAIKQIMELHGKRRYLANIAPQNDPSRFLFTGLGFKLLQNTYVHE